MNIVLLGYGRMGKAIEQQALQRKHTIVEIYDNDPKKQFLEIECLRDVDVCIEFSLPQVAEANCSHCMDLGIPVVSGTTGWAEGVSRLQHRAIEEEKSFFYASNFSLGVNILFEINRRLAQIMALQPAYKPSIREIHHVHKLDAPSGTALTLAGEILKTSNRYTKWTLSPSTSEEDLYIEALREGEVPGVHEVTWKSLTDEIVLHHEAFSREGFALGAVLAAEYACTHRGALSMDQMLGF